MSSLTSAAATHATQLKEQESAAALASSAAKSRELNLKLELVDAREETAKLRESFAQSSADYKAAVESTADAGRAAAIAAAESAVKTMREDSKDVDAILRQVVIDEARRKATEEAQQETNVAIEAKVEEGRAP